MRVGLSQVTKMFCVTFLVKWNGACYTKNVKILISNSDSLVPWSTKVKKAVKFIRLQVASITPRLFLIEKVWVHTWKEEMSLEVRLGNKVPNTFSTIQHLAYAMLT